MTAREGRLRGRDLALAVGAAALLLVVVLAASIRHDAHCERGGEEAYRKCWHPPPPARSPRWGARVPKKTEEAYVRVSSPPNGGRGIREKREASNHP